MSKLSFSSLDPITEEIGGLKAIRASAEKSRKEVLSWKDIPDDYKAECDKAWNKTLADLDEDIGVLVKFKEELKKQIKDDFNKA